MGRAIEVVTGRVTNPGATITALTANTNNSFTVRAFGSGKAYLDGLWAQAATAGVMRVRSPKLHDSTQGIRVRTPAAVVRNFWGPAPDTQLFSTDVLTVELSGGGAEVDAGALLVYYEDLDGADAKLATWDQIVSRIANLLTIEVAVTGPTTSGDWSAGNAINSAFDVLKADTKYAVLGYQCDTESLAVALQGPDTANYRIGGPGCIEPLETRDWFIRHSRETNRPYIPIINSNNRGGTLASVAKVGAGGTVNVCFEVAELL